MNTSMKAISAPLLFAHIGDLHLTDAGAQNFADFCALVAQLAIQCPQLDFVFLPGDNGDHGRPEEYRLVSTVLKMLSCPVYAISGDHDMEQGSLKNFYDELKMPVMPYEVRLRQYACFFLDCCGPGAGGPDFRLGSAQMQWLEAALKTAEEDGMVKLICMHTYPDDLVDQQEKTQLLEWLVLYNVRLVAMGHTHYNELGNDGKTIFSATRSTGQIEEGPAGYSLISVDGGQVSWRFKMLEDPFPFVLITLPADYRLQTAGASGDNTNQLIRAIVFSQHRINEVALQIDGEDWIPMGFNQESGSWELTRALRADADFMITVRAIDERSRPGFHQIKIACARSTTPLRFRKGSDQDRILYWPENGIPGSQLGPNRNAKPFPKPPQP